MLSIIILAKNEAGLIKACIDSVKWADEIVVVNDGSTDGPVGTVATAKSKGAKVVDSEFYDFDPDSDNNPDRRDFSRLRDIGLKESKGDWILYIDADERVPQSLREEIEAKMGSQNVIGAWAISRKNIILGQEVSYGPYKNDWVIRFFQRDHLKGWKGKVHEQPEYKGELGYLKNQLIHLTHRDLDQMVNKSLEWSHIDADLRIKANHPKMTSWRFLRIFITESFNQGIKRKGFFNGDVGVIDSMLQVFSLFMSYVRLWELQQKPSLVEKYKEIDEELIENNFRY